MEMPSEASGRVQEIKNRRHHTATHKHRDGTKVPQEEREGEVESSQSKRPEVASSVQVSRNVLAMLSLPSRDRNRDQETHMSVVPDGLDVAEKGHEETYEDREVLDGCKERAFVSEYDRRGCGFGSRGVAYEDADDGTESDCCCG